MATIFFFKIDRSRRNVKIYKWKWVVLSALGCMNNTDLGKDCARCVYYLSENTTRTSNLKNTVFVIIDLQNNPLKRP